MKFVKDKRNKLTLAFMAVFFLIVLSVILSCSSPTNKKGNLSGSIDLEEQDDNSSIVVALYNLAYLDTTVVRINDEYPQIGVHINQQTEFDHRLQSPVYKSETNASGGFNIKNISTGTYNFVAIKNGWGFRYIYEVHISKGDNNLGTIENNISLNKDWIQTSNEKNSNITLYPETNISGNIYDSYFFETNHHYIVSEDTYFTPDSYLEINSGCVVRIAPSKDLIIYGTFKAQGEENNLFWITCNDGFDEGLIENDSLQFCNSLELSNIASVSDNIIEWGKWDYSTNCLTNNIDNIEFNNLIFKNAKSGLQSVGNTETIHTIANHILCNYIFDTNRAGIYFINNSGEYIKNSIFTNCSNGVKVKDNFTGEVYNNYFYNDLNGAELLFFLGNFRNNILASNSKDIFFDGNNTDTVQDYFTIKYNKFMSGTALYQYYYYQAYNHGPKLKIRYNNFYHNDTFLVYCSRFMLGITDEIVMTNNYFDGLNTSNSILERMYDFFNENFVTVNIDNYKVIPNNDTGIIGE